MNSRSISIIASIAEVSQVVTHTLQIIAGEFEIPNNLLHKILEHFFFVANSWSLFTTLYIYGGGYKLEAIYLRAISDHYVLQYRRVTLLPCSYIPDAMPRFNQIRNT